MKIVYGIKNLKKLSNPTVVTVGVFDGVHIGHQKIIAALLRHAKALRATSMVVTFDPHPERALKDNASVSMLTALNHRLALLSKLSVDMCLVLRFDKSLARKNSRDFIQRLLIEKLNMKELVVGENFSFGSENLHEFSKLQEMAFELGFKVKEVSQRRVNSRTISSTYIRQLIEKGKLKAAERRLGRPVSILGTVIKGKQRGRRLGFKTANIDPQHETIPPSGVYATYATLGKKTYKSVLNIGTRPTFGEKEPTLEVHIIGLDRGLYGVDIELGLVKRLRAERRFKHAKSLREQIIKDISLAKQLL